MPNGNDDKDHTSSNVWNRLDQHGDQLSALARSQATTEANLSALANSVDTGFQQVNKALARLAEKDSRPTNWIGVGSVILAFLAASVTFVTLVVAPIKTEVAAQKKSHDEDIALLHSQDAESARQLEERAFLIGKSQEAIEWLKREADRK